MSNMSQIQQQMMLVEQLRREASFVRMPMSISIDELKAYIATHQQDDSLLTGFTSQKANPYREKSACEILWGGSQDTPCVIVIQGFWQVPGVPLLIGGP